MKIALALLISVGFSFSAFANQNVKFADLTADIPRGDLVHIYFQGKPRVEYPNPTNENSDRTVNVIDLSLLRIVRDLCDSSKSISYTDAGRFVFLKNKEALIRSLR